MNDAENIDPQAISDVGVLKMAGLDHIDPHIPSRCPACAPPLTDREAELVAVLESAPELHDPDEPHFVDAYRTW